MRYIATFFTLIVILLSGPVTAQQWESFNVATDPLSGSSKLRTIQNKVYLAGWDGLYRSNDGGDHWQKIRSYQSQDGFQVFEVNRNNNRLYWTEGLDTMGFWKLYSSADLGNTWQLIGNAKATVSAFIGDTIFGFGYNGSNYDIRRKFNNGPWTPLLNWPTDTVGNLLRMCSEGSHLWIATVKGIYHSPDAGYTWELSTTLNNVQVTVHPNGMPTLLIEAVNGEVVLIDEIKNQMLLTQDHGATWQEATWTGMGLQNSGQHLYSTDSTGTQLWRFEGGDATNWKIIPLNAQNDILLDGVGEFDGTNWLGSQRFGVIRKKADSDKWLVANGDITPYSGYKLQFMDGDLFADNLIQTFSPDNGTTWQQGLRYSSLGEHWQNGDYNYLIPSAGLPQLPLLRCPRNERFEWDTFANPPFGFSRVVNSGDTVIITGAAPYDLHRSYNNGLSWDTVPGTLGNVAIRSHKGKFYALKDKTLYRTDDVGTTWQPVYTFPNNMNRLHILHDTMIVSYVPSDQIFYSIDDGQSFNILPAPQNPNTSVYNLLSYNGLLLLYMNDGLLRLSRDVGQTWLSIAAPPGVNFNNIVNGNYWTYGNNTLFLSDNWRLRLDGQRQMSGKVFLDSNGNGQKDIGETGLNNYIVTATQSNALGATYNDGDFSMLLGQGADELSVANVPIHYVAAPVTVSVPSGTGSIPQVSFAIQPQGTVNDASVTLVAASAFRAGYDNTLYASLKNAGTIPNSGQLKLVLPPLLSMISATPAADEKVGDTLIWNYDNLLPLKERKFQVDVSTALVPPGTPVVIQAEVLTGSDVDPANNEAALDGQVVSSYDPNDKSVSATHVPVNEADAEELVYTIRFQNLGNVETDFITVRDTLSASLDAASVRVITASHPFEWHIEEGRILVFRFNPIRLAPVAQDSMRSQGFVQFAARLKPGLQVGDEIANTAHIYFDFNPAVVTNTVVTSIAVVATFEPSQRELPLDVFPNPASSRVTLRLPEGDNSKGRIDIFSVEGRLVYSATTQGNTQTIEVQDIAAGAYWCRWVVAGKVFWGKLIVQR